MKELDLYSQPEHSRLLSELMEFLAQVLQFDGHQVRLGSAWRTEEAGQAWHYLENMSAELLPCDPSKIGYFRYFSRYGSETAQIIADLASEKRVQFREWEDSAPGRAALRFPLFFDNELAAVIRLGRSSSRSFTALEALTAVAATRIFSRSATSEVSHKDFLSLKAHLIDAARLVYEEKNPSVLLETCLGISERFCAPLVTSYLLPTREAGEFVVAVHSHPRSTAASITANRSRFAAVRRAFKSGRAYIRREAHYSPLVDFRGLASADELVIPMAAGRAVQGMVVAQALGRSTIRRCHAEVLLVLAAACSRPLALAVAQSQLEQSHTYLQAVVDAVGDELAVINAATWKVELANRAKKEKFPGALEGRKCWAVFENRRAEGPCPGCPTRYARDHGTTVEQVLYHPRVGDQAVEVTAAPVCDERGRVDRLVEVVRDVSAREAMLEGFASMEQARNQDELCERAVQALVRMHFSRARLYRVDPETGALTGYCLAGEPLERISFRGFPASQKDIHRPSGKGRLVPVLFYRRRSRAIAQEPPWPTIEVDDVPHERELEKSTVSEWVDVPIAIHGRLVAKITADKKGMLTESGQPVPISWHDMQLLRSFSEFASIAYARSEALAIAESSIAQQRLAEVGMLSAGVVHEISGAASSARNSAEGASNAASGLLRVLADLEKHHRDSGVIPEILRAVQSLWRRTLRRPEGARRLKDRDAVYRLLDKRGLDSDPQLAYRLAPARGSPELSTSIDIAAAGGTLHPLRLLAEAAGLKTNLASVQNSVNRIERLKHALLQLVPERLAARQMVNVNRTVENALLLVRSRRPRGTTIERRLSSASLTTYGSPAGLTYVWLCLLNNALDAVRPPGRVRVTTRSTKGEIRVTVSNDGPSIPESLIPRIFDAGFTTKTSDVHSGLGLTVARDLVEVYHQGRIVVSSQDSRTLFSVRLPIRRRTP